jgi:hypothetical protein
MSTKNESGGPPADPSIKEIREGIEHTRTEMSATLTALEDRLSPGVLGDKANAELDHLEARVKSAVKEGIEEAKAAAAVTVKEGLDHAKEAVAATLKEGIDHAKEAVAVTVKEGVQEAKEAVTHGLKEARETVKKDVQDAFHHTQHTVREATLGRVEDLATKAGDVMNDTRETLVETIRQNPIPAALAGIGIAWLFMNRSSASRRRSTSMNGSSNGYNPYRGMGYDPVGGSAASSALASAQHAVSTTAGNVAHRIGSVAGQVGAAIGHAGEVVGGAAHDAGNAAMGAIGTGADAVTHLAHDAQAAAERLVHGASDATTGLAHGAADAAGQLAHRAEEMAGSVAGTAREQASRVEGGVASAWDANPLAFGAAALVAGAALGYALPRTKKEDQLMGDVRDRVVHEAAHMATEAVHSLQHVAEDAGKAAKDAVKTASV